MMIYSNSLLILFLLLLTAQSFQIIKPTSYKRCLSESIDRKSKLTLRVVEHLIDCANNPQLANIYGGANSLYCLQPHGSDVTNGLTGMFQQFLTMGFLITSYYTFKRINVLDAFEKNSDSNEERSVEQNFRQCPQCEGDGYIRFPGGMIGCDLCGGIGKIQFVTDPNRRLELPRKINNRNSIIDDDNF